MTAGFAFDKLAAEYDATWSDSATGYWQRQSVWRAIDPLFAPGGSILDLGCGTGIDALHFQARGIEVHAIDASAEMVRIARARGVDAHVGQVSDLPTGSDYDGAISNFGALNCVADLESVARALAGIIRPHGSVAICLMGRWCAWEMLRYGCRLQFRKAFRRWRRPGSPASIGVRVYYPSLRRLVRAFHPHFHLVRWCGIGFWVPPFRADRHLARLPILRALADHRLLIFERAAP